MRQFDTQNPQAFMPGPETSDRSATLAAPVKKSHTLSTLRTRSDKTYRLNNSWSSQDRCLVLNRGMTWQKDLQYQIVRGCSVPRRPGRGLGTSAREGWDQ
jgi:hypothetical protein